MNARLSSLLVAGGVVLAGIQVAGAARAAAPGADPTHQPATLIAASLDPAGVSDPRCACLSLHIPGFDQKPRLQVLSDPLRVVVDLPGVNKAMKFGRKDAEGLNHPLIHTSRIAQFATSPTPVTRVVLEVAPGTQVEVAQAPNGLRLMLSPGAGAVQAKFGPSHVPAAPVQALPVETEVVTALAVIPSAVWPDVVPRSLGEMPLGVSAVTTEAKLAPPAPEAFRPMPPVGAAYRPLPSFTAMALVPLSLGEAGAQDPPPAEAKPQPAPVKSGRTLGDAPTRYTGTRMSIDVHGTNLMTFLGILTDAGKLNLVADPEVETMTGSFKFTDTPWDQILDVILKHFGLGKEIENGVIRVARVERLAKEEDDRKKLEEAKSLAGDVQSITRPLSYAKAVDVKAILDKGMISKRGSVIIDERTNTLIISDLQRYLTVVDDLIAQLDIATQQVQIEAKVVEAQHGYEKAFGVKWPTANTGPAQLTVGGESAPWGASNAPSWNSINNRPGPGQSDLAVAFSPGKDGQTSIPNAAGEFWISFLSNRISVNAILQAMEHDGTVKIVSSPRLVTQNNKKGKILSGQKIPYQSIQGGGQAGAITVQFAEANLELDVTPQITNDGTILMDLNIEKAEADFSRQVQGTPTIIRKTIQTQVLVRDGGTAVLGGVYTTNNATGTTGVPFLSKLPLIGWLFRNRTQNDQNQELLVFITPRIIRN
jgi:type IV pilus assembly protein PilQ